MRFRSPEANGAHRGKIQVALLQLTGRSQRDEVDTPLETLHGDFTGSGVE